MPRASLSAPVGDPQAPEGEARERGGIQSLERGFAILEEIARNRDGITLGELSKRLGLHTSTTFHLVQTLVTLGYAHQEAATRRYRIGRGLFALAAGSRDEVALIEMATPVLAELSAASAETGHFGVWSGAEVLVLVKTPGAGAFQIADGFGVRRPAYCTALGKALLAELPPAALDRYLAGRALPRLTPSTISEADQLRRQLGEVRLNGIAYDDREFDPELRCVAAVVHDFTRQTAGVIGLSGPVWRLTLQALHDMAELVHEAAERLSASLGGGR
ncbi:MAG: IclR family transcriptional regulator [Acetobacteraceae bacterium]